MLEVSAVTKRFGGFTALSGVDLSISRGDRHAVIGPNGAGKSTLFNVVSGLVVPEEGTVVFEGHRLARMNPSEIVRIGMARSFQRVNIFPRKSSGEKKIDAAVATILAMSRAMVGATSDPGIGSFLAFVAEQNQPEQLKT